MTAITRVGAEAHLTPLSEAVGLPTPPASVSSPVYGLLGLLRTSALAGQGCRQPQHHLPAFSKLRHASPPLPVHLPQSPAPAKGAQASRTIHPDPGALRTQGYLPVEHPPTQGGTFEAGPLRWRSSRQRNQVSPGHGAQLDGQARLGPRSRVVGRKAQPHAEPGVLEVARCLLESWRPRVTL